MSEESAQPIDFEQLREFFADESEYGQLFDIVAPDIDLARWRVFLRQVVPRYTHQFSLITGESSTAQDIPEDTDLVVQAANSERGPWPYLCMELLGLSVRVHFFSATYLELDAWRTEVTAERYACLCTLMQRMGDSMGVDVFGTPESDSSRAEFVYEVAHRRFRRPKRGIGGDGHVRDLVLNELRQAVEPLLAANISAEDIRGVLDGVESIRAAHHELVLQDELATEERRMLDDVWSLAATLVSPPPGIVYTAQNRECSLNGLISIARTLH